MHDDDRLPPDDGDELLPDDDELPPDDDDLHTDLEENFGDELLEDRRLPSPLGRGPWSQETYSDGIVPRVPMLSPEQEAKQLKRSLCRNAGGGSFGLQKVLGTNVTGPDPVRTNLFILSREENSFSKLPQLLAISIDLDFDLPNLGRDTLEVFARLTWQTGAGNNFAEIDVPARGTVAVVVAGDGLQVDLFRNAGPAANQDVVRARGNVGFASSLSCCNARRTIQTGPLPMLLPLEIPRFARSVTTFPDVFGAIAPPAGTLRFFREIGVAPMLVVAAPTLGQGAGIPIPNGALFFDVTGVALAAVQAVFEIF